MYCPWNTVVIDSFLSSRVQHSLIQLSPCCTVWVWLQGASAAPLRSSVMLSQSVLFIKVLIQLHWCFHSEKKGEPKGTKHAQSHSWSIIYHRLATTHDHHEGICYGSRNHGNWWLSKHKLYFIRCLFNALCCLCCSSRRLPLHCVSVCCAPAVREVKRVLAMMNSGAKRPLLLIFLWFQCGYKMIKQEIPAATALS